MTEKGVVSRQKLPTSLKLIELGGVRSRCSPSGDQAHDFLLDEGQGIRGVFNNPVFEIFGQVRIAFLKCSSRLRTAIRFDCSRSSSVAGSGNRDSASAS